MAVEVHQGRAEHGHEEGVYHQFEAAPQQNEAYIVGMWTFLVTEVMFFGPLFFTYVLYRWMYQDQFYKVHQVLDIPLGATNTAILLLSSFTMAMGVYFKQTNRLKQSLVCLGITFCCAAGFLIVKYFEWSHKFHMGHVPGAGFTWDVANPELARIPGVETVPANVAEMFFSL
jgi:cytochrome c oxidase subunit 3